MQPRIAITLGLLALELLMCASSSATMLSAGSASGVGAALPQTLVCPAKLPANPLSTRPGAALALVPPGATSLVLCSYHGLNPLSRSSKLGRARTVGDATELGRLTHEFDTLPKASKLIFCPMDDGSAILATFSYRNAPSNPVSVGLTGCQIVTNGHVTRTAARAPGPALVAQLTALLG